jgi:copper homeostasis protein
LGCDGVVFGVLNENGEIDISRNKDLIKLARPMSVTFHRAFDVSRDAEKSLENLIKLNVDRVLTSGQEATAFEGLEKISELVKLAGNKIIVLACGNLNAANINKFIEKTKVKEVHLTGFTKIESPMKFRNERVFMGGTLGPPEFSRLVTSPEIINSVVKNLK